MADIAVLGLEVRSQPVTKASAELDRFSGASLRAERAARGLGAQSTATGRMMVAANENAAASATRMSAAYASAGRVIASSLAPLAALFGVAELGTYADAWSDLSARVGIAIRDMDRAPEVMERIQSMARRTYSSLETTTEAFLNNSTALRELGYSTKQQLDFTEALNNALVVSGARGERAASVQNALSRALALGALRGEELNIVIQTGGRVAEALADSMGVTVNELRRLGTQGKITSSDIFGIVTQIEKLREEADSMPATLGDALSLTRNAMIELVGSFDQARGVSSDLAEKVIGVADTISRMAAAFRNANSEINVWLDRIIAVSDWIWEMRARMLSFMTLGLLDAPAINAEPVGNRQIAPPPPGFPLDIKPENPVLPGITADQEKALKAFDDYIARLELANQMARNEAEGLGYLNTQLEAEFALRRAMNRELTQGEKDRLTTELIEQEKLARQATLTAQKDQLDMLALEQSLIGATATERAVAVALLAEEQRLKRELIPLTSEEAQQRLANAAQIARETEERLKQAEAINFARDANRSFFQDIRSGLQEGKGLWRSFGDAVVNVLNRIAQRLTDMMADGLFDALFSAGSSSSGGGILGSVVSGIGGLLGFSSGGYTGDGPSNKVAGVVHAGEFVVNAAATARHRALLEAMNDNRPGAMAQRPAPRPVPTASAQHNRSPENTGSNVINISVDARGATDPAAVEAAVRRGVNALRKEIPGIAVNSVAAAKVKSGSMGRALR